MPTTKTKIEPGSILCYCYRSGHVHFGHKLPSGALPIHRFQESDKKTRDQIEVLCRLSYDGKTLLVPGIPEAASDEDAEKAFEFFCEWLQWCLLPKERRERTPRPERPDIAIRIPGPEHH
jgi:hypothetical protein